MATILLNFADKQPQFASDQPETRTEYVFRMFQFAQKLSTDKRPAFVEGFMYSDDIKRIRNATGLDPYSITSPYCTSKLRVTYEITPETILLFRK